MVNTAIALIYPDGIKNVDSYDEYSLIIDDMDESCEFSVKGESFNLVFERKGLITVDGASYLAVPAFALFHDSAMQPVSADAELLKELEDFLDCSYVGDKYDLFMNYCLAIFEEGRKGFYVRSAPFYDVEAGSVTLNGAVPEGALIQIGTADKKICVESCAESLKTALDGYPGSKPAAALHFSCAGRKMMMGTQVVREYKTVKNHLIDIPFCGYYAYGEICRGAGGNAVNLEEYGSYCLPGLSSPNGWMRCGYEK